MDERSRKNVNDRAGSNRLLRSIPAHEFELLEHHLEPVELTFKLTLYEATQPIGEVYFIDSGVVSLVTSLDDDHPVEVATVGPEGMVGIPIILAADQIGSRAFVQIVGHGRKMAADTLRELLPRCPELNRLLLRYALALMNMM